LEQVEISTFGFELANVLCTDLNRCEEPQERSSVRCCLDCLSTTGFLSFNNAHDRGDVHAGFACRFDCGDCRCSRCADVIDDDDSGAFAAETFNAATSAVSLFGFANEKAVKQRRGLIVLRAPGARGGYIGDDRIRAHCETTDSFGFNSVLLEEF
jgi:hypothetical protein